MTTAEVIERILDDEGGIADVADGHGITRFGQTPIWLADHGLPPPHNRDVAHANYAIWMERTGLLELTQQDGYAGWVITDAAVHFGLSVAIKMLQRALNVSDDGKLGPMTRSRFMAVANHPVFHRKLIGHKAKAYGQVLGSEAVDRRRWSRGWMNRFAKQVEALPL